MTYSPSGDELETQVSCEVLVSEPDIQQDEHRYFARAFNALCRMCLWHTHASVALNNLARAGRNSPGALWYPSSPDTVKSSQLKTVFVPLAWHRWEYLELGREQWLAS